MPCRCFLLQCSEVSVKKMLMLPLDGSGAGVVPVCAGRCEQCCGSGDALSSVCSTPRLAATKLMGEERGGELCLWASYCSAWKDVGKWCSASSRRCVLAKRSVFSCLLLAVPVGSAHLVPGMSILQQCWFNGKHFLAGLSGIPHALPLPVLLISIQ